MNASAGPKHSGQVARFYVWWARGPDQRSSSYLPHAEPSLPAEPPRSLRQSGWLPGSMVKIIVARGRRRLGGTARLYSGDIGLIVVATCEIIFVRDF